MNSTVHTVRSAINMELETDVGAGMLHALPLLTAYGLWSMADDIGLTT